MIKYLKIKKLKERKANVGFEIKIYSHRKIGFVDFSIGLIELSDSTTK